MYVSKRTESKRGGGTISATRRSAGTSGSRAHRDSGAASAIGLWAGAVVEDDTAPNSRRRATLRDMRRLFPVTYETADHAAHEAREWSLDELADAYAYPAGQDVWLRANMVSTLDGAAQHDGRSQGISNAADMRIFGTLRGLADAVLVGAETVRLEGYRPARAREAFAGRREAAGQAPAPAIAVITGSLNLDFSLPLFTSPSFPRSWSPAPGRRPTGWTPHARRAPRC